MKDTKNEVNTNEIESCLKKLIIAVEGEITQCGNHDRVVDAIMDTMAERLINSEGFGALHSAYVCSLPSWERKTLSVGAAMTFVTDNHLLEYINLIDDVESFIKLKEVGTSSPEALKWRQAFYSLSDLKEFATGELFDRVQVYNNEIKELKGEN